MKVNLGFNVTNCGLLFTFVDEELLDEEEIEYEEDEIESDISDIDDDDLMKRLEAKYGKISGENSEDEDDHDASWTSNLQWFTNKLDSHLIPLSFAYLLSYIC